MSLFQDNLQQALNFYIIPGPNRKNLKHLIETNGGKVTLNKNQAFVCLWSEISK
jgi:hypothetical protein